MKKLNTLSLLGAVLLLTVVTGQARLNAQESSVLKRLAAAGDLLIAREVDTEIPVDGSSRVWNKAKAYKIPIISQFSVAPRVKTLDRSELTVRVLYNDKEIGLRLSWKDRTVDENVAATERFGDAVAVCFPMTYGNGERLPYVGMGDKEQAVNIWHWKAAWQADVDKGFQGVAETYVNRMPLTTPVLYASGPEAGAPISQQKRATPAENLMAAGFGTLTSTASAGLRAQGVWQKGFLKKGAWRVVLKRPLSPRGHGVDIDVAKGLLPITFATWDGGDSQRNGTKSITRWRFIQFAGKEIPAVSLRTISTGFPQADVERGKRLVDTLECIKCHNLPGAAAAKDVGTDLRFTGAIFRVDYLIDSLKHPNQVVVPAPRYFTPATGLSTMPQYAPEDVNEQDFQDMATYLRTLQ